MSLKDLGQRMAASVDDARDRAAEHLASDETPESRELGRVRRRIDQVEQELSAAMESLSQDQSQRWDALGKRARKTTWPRRFFWLLVGAAAGVAALLSSDPTRR